MASGLREETLMSFAGASEADREKEQKHGSQVNDSNAQILVHECDKTLYKKLFVRSAQGILPERRERGKTSNRLWDATVGSPLSYTSYGNKR